MGAVDNATWFALAVTLTLLGAVATFLLWRRRGAASGLRMLAWTLLPAAAYLTGTLRLLGSVLQDVVDWASRLVFNPQVWLGIAVAGVSVLLFAVSAALRNRGGGRARRAGAAERTGAPKPGAAPQVAGKPGRPPDASVDEDLADIEAILKKHGIS